MGPGLLALASCVLRVALGPVSYDAALGAGTSLRSGSALDGPSWQVEAAPLLGLSWFGRGVELGGAYYPRVFVLEQVGHVQALHRARAAFSLRLDSRWSTFASAEGSYGAADFLGQGTAALPKGSGPSTTGGGEPTPTPLQPNPQAATVQYVSGEATVGIAGTPLARLHLQTRLVAFTSGGTDPDARRALPLQRGGRAVAEIQYDFSPADSLETGLTVVRTTFGPGVKDQYAFVTETWRHALAAEAQLRLGIGAGLLAHDGEGNRTRTLALGGEIGLRDRWLRVLEVDAGLRAGPIVDRTTGALYARADAALTLAWVPSPRWALAASATAGSVLQGTQAGDRIFAGELRGSWSPARRWTLALGARGLSQVASSASTPRTWEAVAFLSAEFRDRF